MFVNFQCWSYFPEGFGKMIQRFYKKYKKPILIAESGICTDDPHERIKSIKDYLIVIHKNIQEGIPILGYIHWSTFDNFEWNLGPTYRFGLVQVDPKTKASRMTEAGLFFSEIAQKNQLNTLQKNPTSRG